jgi:hypothetical protein
VITEAVSVSKSIIRKLHKFNNSINTLSRKRSLLMAIDRLPGITFWWRLLSAEAAAESSSAAQGRSSGAESCVMEPGRVHNTQLLTGTIGLIRLTTGWGCRSSPVRLERAASTENLSYQSHS